MEKEDARSDEDIGPWRSANHRYYRTALLKGGVLNMWPNKARGASSQMEISVVSNDYTVGVYVPYVSRDDSHGSFKAEVALD